MNLSDKQELVRLLNTYQDEQITQNMTDNSTAKFLKTDKTGKYAYDYKSGLTVGTKAQYEHARLISSKLSLEISRELKSYWEL